jgi:hypothetical protein
MMDSIVSRGSDASMVTREGVIVAGKNAGGDQSDVGREGWVVEDGRRGAADGFLSMVRHLELVESLRLPESSNRRLSPRCFVFVLQTGLCSGLSWC